MTFQQRFPILSDHAILGSRRRPGRLIQTVRFIVAHDTGNPNVSADNHARYYRNDPNPPLNTVSSAHLFVDDEAIVETIPAFDPAEQALHVLRDKPTDNLLYGVDANRAAIGVEYCFGSGIDAAAAYDRFVWVIAALCDHHRLDPSRDVVGHQILDPGRKVDPGQGLGHSGRSYAGLLADVVAEYRRAGGDPARIGQGTASLAGRKVKATVRLQRRAAPATDAASTGIIAPGSMLTVTRVVNGTRVSGNDDWCALADGGFCWSGGVVAV